MSGCGLIPLPSEPSAAVTNVTVSLVENDNEVNITWKPLKAGEWNGVPFGYYVSSHSILCMVLCVCMRCRLCQS